MPQTLCLAQSFSTACRFSLLTLVEGFGKSPSAALRFNFVAATHPKVRLPLQFSRTLQVELFTKAFDC
jgi:hypothetical protein